MLMRGIGDEQRLRIKPAHRSGTHATYAGPVRNSGLGKHRVDELVGMQAALHQHLHLAFGGQGDGPLGSGMAVRHRLDADAVQRQPAAGGQRAQPRLGPDQQRLDQPGGGGVQRATQRAFVAGVNHGAGQWPARHQAGGDRAGPVGQAHFSIAPGRRAVQAGALAQAGGGVGHRGAGEKVGRRVGRQTGGQVGQPVSRWWVAGGHLESLGHLRTTEADEARSSQTCIKAFIAAAPAWGRAGRAGRRPSGSGPTRSGQSPRPGRPPASAPGTAGPGPH